MTDATQRRVAISTVDGVANAYLSTPDRPGPAPALLVYPDAFGLRPVFERLADQVAGAGYAALVPNVYHRLGRRPVGALPDPIDLAAAPKLRERVGPLMRSLDLAAVRRDAAAYLTFLAGAPEVVDGPVGVSGYCMGARLALWTAAAVPARVAAVAAFHGGGLATGDPDSPHLGAGDLRAEVYLGHADQDRGMPPEQVARLDRALDEAGVRHRTEVYVGAPHGFAVADTSAYRPDAAERHLRELVALLDRTLPQP